MSLDRPRTKVFLSYAHEDRAVAEHIAESLRARSLEVWFDQWELAAGDSISHKIRQTLEASDFLVVLLSPGSVRSKWFQFEVSVALERELQDRAVTVLPVLIEDCEIPPALAGRVMFDLREGALDSIARLADQLAGAPAIDLAALEFGAFENLLADLFEAEGYTVEREGRAAEFQWDLMLSDRGKEGVHLHGQAAKVVVEVKQYRHGRADLASLHKLAAMVDTLGIGFRGMLVTNGQLTSVSREWLANAQAQGGKLEVLDGTRLRALLLKYPRIVRRYFGGQS